MSAGSSEMFLGTSVSRELVGLLIAQTAAYLLTFVIGMTLPVFMESMSAPQGFATVPNTAMLLATLVGSHLTSALRAHLRWHAIFAIAGLFPSLAAALALMALANNQVVLMTAAAVLYGLVGGATMWLRFARSASETQLSTSRFMAAMTSTGIVAAFAAPMVVSALASEGERGFAAVHVSAAVFGAVICGSAFLLRTERTQDRRTAAREEPAQLEATTAASFAAPLIAAAISFAAMGTLMAGTPLTMALCGFGLDSVADTYRYHLLAMFLPSLMVLPITGKLSSTRMMQLGIGINLCGFLVGIAGTAESHFVWSMALNGAGWSITLVGASSLVAQLGRRRGLSLWPARFNSLCVLSNAVGALSGGALAAMIGWRMTLVCYVTALGTGCIGIFLLERSQPQAVAKEQAS